ncbi:MAG: helix-turn-helix domain-containing protein [Candidatus Omnitrophota bacterium]|nr:helix-turn-helix domain-containing protein [Candidatus Omnitrophota bacterium]
METITPNEIAAILRIHPFTVTRLAREGKLPAFSARGGSANLCGGKVGGIWRFRKDQFEQWIEERTSRNRRHQKNRKTH